MLTLPWCADPSMLPCACPCSLRNVGVFWLRLAMYIMLCKLVEVLEVPCAECLHVSRLGGLFVVLHVQCPASWRLNVSLLLVLSAGLGVAFVYFQLGDGCAVGWLGLCAVVFTALPAASCLFVFRLIALCVIASPFCERSSVESYSKYNTCPSGRILQMQHLQVERRLLAGGAALLCGGLPHIHEASPWVLWCWPWAWLGCLFSCWLSTAACIWHGLLIIC